MLLNGFVSTFLITFFIIYIECCTKVTFVNSVIKITRKGEFQPTTTATITGCITPEIIDQQLGQVTVTHILCENQTIPTLREKAVSNFPELSSLKLSYSKIRRIEENAFFNLPKLDSLDLSSNEITTIPQNAFQNLDLISLTLRENKLVFLEHEIFANLPRLAVIGLDHNELESFDPNWFTTSPNLYTIDINNNYIRTIQKHTFKSFPKLQNIDLSSNHINYIHKDAFEGLEVLENLYLHDNRIKKLDQDVFQPLKKISSLWLHGNNITYISDKTLKDLTDNGSLFQVTVHTNPWQCECYDKILRWAHKMNFYIVTGIDCYNENNPVCVIPTDNEDQCLEVRDEDLNSMFYERYNFNHVCVDRRK